MQNDYDRSLWVIVGPVKNGYLISKRGLNVVIMYLEDYGNFTSHPILMQLTVFL